MKVKLFYGGGRYDRLAETLGGRETYAVGFAIGIERIMSIVEIPDDKIKRIDFYIISNSSDENKQRTNTLARLLREKGNSVELDLLNRSFNAQMKHANKLKTKVALIIGEDEVQNNEIIIKNMDSGEESKVNFIDFVETIFD